MQTQIIETGTESVMVSAIARIYVSTDRRIAPTSSETVSTYQVCASILSSAVVDGVERSVILATTNYNFQAHAIRLAVAEEIASGTAFIHMERIRSERFVNDMPTIIAPSSKIPSGANPDADRPSVYRALRNSGVDHLTAWRGAGYPNIDSAAIEADALQAN